MTTPQVLMTKARIATFLARVKAGKHVRARYPADMEQAIAIPRHGCMTRIPGPVAVHGLGIVQEHPGQEAAQDSPAVIPRASSPRPGPPARPAHDTGGACG
ncbi:MAG TPA: hypothetical protein PKH69_05670 [Thiobacillaceae bacterium]|nr:hypothetical protein [Thiobacillaceae bacterium]HNU64196.1 hypothetical protein [Thiobacillaceae bacterium]